jgi:hypothetical protein
MLPSIPNNFGKYKGTLYTKAGLSGVLVSPVISAGLRPARGECVLGRPGEGEPRPYMFMR